MTCGGCFSFLATRREGSPDKNRRHHTLADSGPRADEKPTLPLKGSRPSASPVKTSRPSAPPVKELRPPPITNARDRATPSRPSNPPRPKVPPSKAPPPSLPLPVGRKIAEQKPQPPARPLVSRSPGLPEDTSPVSCFNAQTLQKVTSTASAVAAKTAQVAVTAIATALTPSTRASSTASGQERLKDETPATRLGKAMQLKDETPARSPDLLRMKALHLGKDGAHYCERCRSENIANFDMCGGNNFGGDSPVKQRVVDGVVVKQPEDGACLFHSIAFGLDDGTSGDALRKRVATIMQTEPNLKIANTNLTDWVRMSTGQGLLEYARQLYRGEVWGGALEMAVTAKVLKVNIHVYEQCKGGFRLISAFNEPLARRTVNVAYKTEPCNHYDALCI
jgi:hypothetical protein